MSNKNDVHAGREVMDSTYWATSSSSHYATVTQSALARVIARSATSVEI